MLCRFKISQKIEYNIPDLKGEICGDQPEACSEWELSSLELSYEVLGSERVEELR